MSLFRHLLLLILLLFVTSKFPKIFRELACSGHIKLCCNQSNRCSHTYIHIILLCAKRFESMTKKKWFIGNNLVGKLVVNVLRRFSFLSDMQRNRERDDHVLINGYYTNANIALAITFQLITKQVQFWTNISQNCMFACVCVS